LFLTGGFWALDTNNRFTDSLRDKLRQIYGQNAPSICMSYDTLYDASIGAALMAADNWNKLDSAGTLFKKFVAQSLGKHIPECLCCTATRAGLVLLDSARGRSKYLEFNRRFVERLINTSSIDLNLKRRFIPTMQLLISNLDLMKPNKRIILWF
jgi:hypothetical protein